MASCIGGQVIPKAKRERRERTDNYHLIQQWCRTPDTACMKGFAPASFSAPRHASTLKKLNLFERTLRRVSDAFDRQGLLDLIT